MKKILFVALMALCGVSFGKPISSSDSTEVTALEPVPEADNAVDCAACNEVHKKADYNPDIIEEIEECIDNCMNK